MRLNPQVIVARAAQHPGRKAYAAAHPGAFARIAHQVMSRCDDVFHQAEYWLHVNQGKKSLPVILKRVWAQRISSMDAFAMSKYGQTGIGLVDVVRLCHAKGYLVDTLMRDGKLPMPEGENTRERLRASGMGWQEILQTIRMPHMALLRNLRGIFSEVHDPDTRENVLSLLKRGVRHGKQFPFRYFSAWEAVKAEHQAGCTQVQNALEECMDISCENLPALKGNCTFLTANSGSAWSFCTSEYGAMSVAGIGNLSSATGAMRAENGVVFPFCDRLESAPIHKDESILAQTHRVNSVSTTCGMARKTAYGRSSGTRSSTNSAGTTSMCIPICRQVTAAFSAPIRKSMRRWARACTERTLTSTCR